MGPPLDLDVFGLGQCAFDRLALVDAFPDPDTKREAVELREECGGPVATALVALARWGRRCAIAGAVGDDPEGERIRADLLRERVDVSGLLARPGGRSQLALVTVERGSGRRTIVWRRPTGAPPRPDELPPPRARVALLDGLEPEASLAVARGHPRVVVDAGTLREGTRVLLDHAQVFVASESFARAFVGADDPAGACRRMHEHGVAVAGVTLGARGYVYSTGGRVERRPAVAVEAVDTTGCGDLFHAGLVHGMLAGWDWERCFAFGAWAGARVATALGGRAGIPDPAAFGA